MIILSGHLQCLLTFDSHFLRKTRFFFFISFRGRVYKDTGTKKVSSGFFYDWYMIKWNDDYSVGKVLG